MFFFCSFLRLFIFTQTAKCTFYIRYQREFLIEIFPPCVSRCVADDRKANALWYRFASRSSKKYIEKRKKKKSKTEK